MSCKETKDERARSVEIRFPLHSQPTYPTAPLSAYEREPVKHVARDIESLLDPARSGAGSSGSNSPQTRHSTGQSEAENGGILRVTEESVSATQTAGSSILCKEN